jgi:hypothetical protein
LRDGLEHVVEGIELGEHGWLLPLLRRCGLVAMRNGAGRQRCVGGGVAVGNGTGRGRRGRGSGGRRSEGINGSLVHRASGLIDGGWVRRVQRIEARARRPTYGRCASPGNVLVLRVRWGARRSGRRGVGPEPTHYDRLEGSNGKSDTEYTILIRFGMAGEHADGDFNFPRYRLWR